MNAQQHSRSLKLTHHTVERICVEATFFFAAHDRRKHEESAHKCVDDATHHAVVEEGRPNREENCLRQAGPSVEDRTDDIEVEERAVIGDENQAVFGAKVGEVLHSPSLYSRSRHQPREVHHDHSVPQDQEWTAVAEQHVCNGKPEALDARHILELFGGRANHAVTELVGGVSPLSGMMALG